MANRKETTKSNWGRITKDGMGGFLNAPTHPEHYYSVSSVYGDTFSMCLSAAVDCTWLNDEAKTKAQELLSQWEPLPLNNSEVQDWILQIMGYFKNCYRGRNSDNECSWNAGDLVIRHDWNPLDWDTLHAGVHLIRKFYPGFILTAEHVKNAYWGTKG